MKFAISIDWYQVYCLSTPETNIVHSCYVSGKSKNSKGYISQYYVDYGIEHHSLYSKSATIRLHDFPLVHIYWSPRPSSLDPKGVAIKVANRVLYSSSWSFYLHDIIAALHLRLVGITRVDLCCDFQKFHGDLLPNVFIQNYVRSGLIETDESEDPAEVEEKPMYIRKGSNSFCIHGSKRLCFGDGEKKRNILGSSVRLDYIRWGTRNSGVCTYLYNKTQELKDKKSKPYIQKFWEEQGIIEDEDLPVYRLELSINAKGLKVRPASLSTKHLRFTPGLVRTLSGDDFATQDAVEQLFWSYAARYFVFKVVGKQRYRKDMKELQLFDVDVVPTVKPSYINKQYDTGTAERRASKTLEKIMMSYPDLRSKESEFLQGASNVLLLIGVIKEQLHSWNEDGLGYFKGVNVTAWDDLKRAGYVTAKQNQALQAIVNKAVAEKLSSMYKLSEYSEIIDYATCVEETIAELDELEQSYWDEVQQGDIEPSWNDYE